MCIIKRRIEINYSFHNDFLILKKGILFEKENV